MLNCTPVTDGVDISCRGTSANLASFLAVWEVAVSGEASGSEGLPWVWMLWSLKEEDHMTTTWFGSSGFHCGPNVCKRGYLNAWRDVVDDADGFAVMVARQSVRDHVELHLSSRLVARLHAIDGFTGGTLKTEDRGLVIELRDHERSGVYPSPTYLPSLLPLLYMATRHWKWYWCPHSASRPTDSARDAGPTPGPLYPDGALNSSMQMVQS